MKGVRQNYQTPAEKGCAKITFYSIDKEKEQRYNMQSLFSLEPYFMHVKSGDYVRLSVNGELMMSDTNMEKETNRLFIENAKGRVMIGGLGIGLIIENLRDKINAGIVTEITIYEKYQDVIDLVYPIYKDLPIKVVCADILEYKPQKGEVYDTIYFDIWPTISTDNLPQIALLHQRWKNHKTKGGWMGSWMCDYLRQVRASESRSKWWW